MKIAQTSIVVFLSKAVGSALGFVATIYFARTLGAELLGVYALTLSFVAWLQLGGKMGIGQAMKKYISEGQEEGEFLTAGVACVALLTALIGALIILAEPYIRSYLLADQPGFEVSVPLILILILLAMMSFSILSVVLQGQHLVYVSGLLEPVKIVLRSVVQVMLVVAGLALLGMFLGYALGLVLVTFIGLYFVSVRPRIPGRRHFRELLNYAKYSWLGGITSRTFSDIDILVLGAFVSSGLVGVYSIAWTISKFLDLFSSAINQAVFPEISNIAAQEGTDAVVGVVEDALSYTGFITIPGLVGGTLLAERLFRIYGPDFMRGNEVLWLLLLSILFYSYMRQFLNTFNAVGRPDIPFRINVFFVVLNVVLNVVLVWQLGWVGAALASATSSLLGMVLSYGLLKNIIDFRFPVGPVGKQLIAALWMGVVVLAVEAGINISGVLEHNFVIVLGLVALGAGTYVATLLLISSYFRRVVRRNLPALSGV